MYLLLGTIEKQGHLEYSFSFIGVLLNGEKGVMHPSIGEEIFA